MDISAITLTASARVRCSCGNGFGPCPNSDRFSEPLPAAVEDTDAFGRRATAYFETLGWTFDRGNRCPFHAKFA